MSDELADLDLDSLNALADLPGEDEAPKESAETAEPAQLAPSAIIQQQLPLGDFPATLEPLPPIPAEGEAGEEPAKSRKLRRPKTVTEIATVAGGVFFGVGVISWVLMTFVFVEKTEEESTLELPRNRLESVMMEMSVGEIRHESISKRKGKEPQAVFIVEIDASIIVQGTASELVKVETLLKSHHHRIEEAIDETIRSASQAHLVEPDAKIIRTRVRDRINEFLGKQIVREVLFGHYRAFNTPIKS